MICLPCFIAKKPESSLSLRLSHGKNLLFVGEKRKLLLLKQWNSIKFFFFFFFMVKQCALLVFNYDIKAQDKNNAKI